MLPSRTLAGLVCLGIAIALPSQGALGAELQHGRQLLQWNGTAPYIYVKCSPFQMTTSDDSTASTGGNATSHNAADDVPLAPAASSAGEVHHAERLKRADLASAPSQVPSPAAAPGPQSAAGRKLLGGSGDSALQENDQAPSVWVTKGSVHTYLRRMQSAPSRKLLHSSSASVIVSRGPKVFYYELPWIWASASGRPSGRTLKEYDGSAPYIWVDCAPHQVTTADDSTASTVGPATSYGA